MILSCFLSLYLHLFYPYSTLSPIPVEILAIQGLGKPKNRRQMPAKETSSRTGEKFFLWLGFGSGKVCFFFWRFMCFDVYIE